MTREFVKALLPVLQAYAEGKVVQLSMGSTWSDVLPEEELDFDDEPMNYRIKPEPRTLYVAEYSDGSFGFAQTTRKAAEDLCGIRVLEVKEVVL